MATIPISGPVSGMSKLMESLHAPISLLRRRSNRSRHPDGKKPSALGTQEGKQYVSY